MNSNEILTRLTEYVSKEILNGDDRELTPTSPLLEWGVINSIEIIKLLGFIHTTFGVRVPEGELTASSFKNLESMTQLITRS